MIKKIVVLALSFVLSLGSFVYTEVSNADPVSYGSGNGTSRTIASVEELTELINSLPTATTYEENADVTQAEGYENFKGITIIENGETSNYKNYRGQVRLDNNPDLPEDEIEYFWSRDHEYSNKRLEMYYDTTCIYYHSIGTSWTATEYFNIDPEGYYAGNMSELEIAKAVATDFDVEIYYSKNRTLMKINKNETYYQEALPTESPREFPRYKRVENPTNKDEDDEPTEQEIYQEIALKAINDNLGIWVELDMNATGVDDMEPDYDAIQNMTPEQQEEYMMNLMIQGLLSELSYQQVASIKQANLLNYAYLARLSAFLTNSIEKPNYYIVSGPKYKLDGTRYIQGSKCNNCSTEFENVVTTCPTCQDDGQIIPYSTFDDTAKFDYLGALMPTWHATPQSNYSYTGNLEFIIGQSSSIKQELERSYSKSGSLYGKFSESFTSHSTIFNVDNTKVNALKGSKVKSLDETYGKSFREAFEELKEQQGGNE